MPCEASLGTLGPLQFLQVRLLIRLKAEPLYVMSEILVLPSKLLHDSLVCLAHRLDSKETVHMLQRNGLGLRDEEEDEEDRDYHERREEKVDAVGHLEEHLWREARDNEVP